MKKVNLLLVISGIIFVILMTFLLIKQNKPSFMTGKEVIYLNDASFAHAKVTVGEYITYEDYVAHKTPPTTVEKVEQRVVNGKVVEVVFLGEIGVRGEKLDISYIDTETQLNEDRFMEYAANNDKQSNNNTVTPSDKTDDQISDNPDDKSDDSKDDNKKDDEKKDDNKDDNKDDKNNQPDGTPSDNTPDGPEPENPPEPEVIPNDEIIRSNAVKEYVSPQNSCQKLGYVVYAPENVTSSTPIFLFLHGIGQNGASYKSYIGAIGFIKFLINGNWAPDVIIVAPILPGGTKWINETANINALLTEVTTTYGGNRGNMYIGGFSAGCDSITPIAKEINFKGALYMGGYLGGVGNTYTTDEFLRLWSGKKAYYFRDSKYGNGGYGYQPNYVNTCEANAASYGVDFMHVDMNWPHRSSMIDAVIMPPYFTDANGNNCRDMLSVLIR